MTKGDENGKIFVTSFKKSSSVTRGTHPDIVILTTTYDLSDPTKWKICFEDVLVLPHPSIFVDFKLKILDFFPQFYLAVDAELSKVGLTVK